MMVEVFDGSRVINSMRCWVVISSHFKLDEAGGIICLFLCLFKSNYILDSIDKRYGSAEIYLVKAVWKSINRRYFV